MNRMGVESCVCVNVGVIFYRPCLSQALARLSLTKVSLVAPACVTGPWLPSSHWTPKLPSENCTRLLYLKERGHGEYKCKPRVSVLIQC